MSAGVADELKTVLLIDDEVENLAALGRILEREGYRVITSDSGDAGLKRFKQEPVDLVITDLKMPGVDGFGVLQKVKELRSEVDVIVVTAHGTIEKAVAAIKQGAYDFIAKPFDRLSITKQVHKVFERQRLVSENERLRAELESRRIGDTIIGNSALFRRVLDSVEQAALSDATVLLLGESGTGKEVLARTLHRSSKRAGRPFVKVSCNTIPDNLLESELFGYERGAFTGAVKRREGRFKIADGGTVFLDEIGDLPLPVQGKLLRVLQEGEFERLGSNTTESVDVRVVAATNRDLPRAIESGQFREDLFYRLNVIQIRIPPLRERREDVALLAGHFLRIYSVKSEKQLEGIDDRAMVRLTGYGWPGNVRELENTIERAVVFAKGVVLTEADLPPLEGARTGGGAGSIEVPLGMPLVDVERQLIEATLEATGGDKVRAAEMLGIASRTIYRKLGEK